MSRTKSNVYGISFVGMQVLPPFIAWQPARVSDEERRMYLDAFAAKVKSIFEEEPLRYPSLDEFDEQWQLRAA